MILNCVIVDDEPIARKLLQEYIEETDFLRLAGVAENPLKAIGILNSQSVDLLFLDINMPKMTGMEFLQSANNLPMVILTTAYGQYALEGFEMAVVDYLVKPFSLDRFIRACTKALELATLRQKKATVENAASGYCYVKCDGKIERVLYADLLFVEAMANYITLYTINKKLVVYLTIKGILEKLPPERFIQVHKSYVVNIGHINTIDGNTLHIGPHKITVSANYNDEVMTRLLKDKFIKR